MNKRGGMNEATEEIIDRYTIADHSCWMMRITRRETDTIITTVVKNYSLSHLQCASTSNPHNEHDIDIDTPYTSTHAVLYQSSV